MRSRPRPTSATLIAIGNILLGLPCLCCSGLMSVGHGTTVFDAQKADQAPGQAIPAAKDDAVKAAQPEPDNVFEKFIEENDEAEDFLQKELPRRAKINLGIWIVLSVSSLVLLVSGVLLLTGRPIGRIVCLVAAMVMVVGALTDAAYCIFIERPATEKFDRIKAQELQAKNLPPAEATETEGLIFAIVLKAIFGLAYPVLAMVVMMTGPVREYYRRDSGRDDDFDRYYSDEGYRRPRYDDFDADR